MQVQRSHGSAAGAVLLARLAGPSLALRVVFIEEEECSPAGSTLSSPQSFTHHRPLHQNTKLSVQDMLQHPTTHCTLTHNVKASIQRRLVGMQAESVRVSERMVRNDLHALRRRYTVHRDFTMFLHVVTYHVR